MYDFDAHLHAQLNSYLDEQEEGERFAEYLEEKYTEVAIIGDYKVLYDEDEDIYFYEPEEFELDGDSYQYSKAELEEAEEYHELVNALRGV